MAWSAGEYQMSLEGEDYMDDTPVYEAWCETQTKSQKFRFTWTIEDFPRRADNLMTGQVLKSDVFSVDEENTIQWRLHLYPRGNVDCNEGYVSIFLALFSSNQPEVSSTIRLTLIGRGNIPLHAVATKRAYTFNHMSPTMFTWGHPTFIPLTTILESHDNCLPDDMLTIVCEGSVIAREIITTGSSGLRFPLVGNSGSTLGGTVSVQGITDLAGDLENYLKSGEFSDLTVVVCDEHYRLHKAILAARSPYIKSLLKSDPPQIEIEGVEPDVMDGVLYYIYTGRNPCLCSENNMDKYLMASHLLQLLHLKASCEEGLAQQIDDTNVEEMAELADRCSAMNLKVAVENYKRMAAQA